MKETTYLGRLFHFRDMPHLSKRSCYSGNMQPESPDNYWQNSTEDQPMMPDISQAAEVQSPGAQPLSWNASEYIQSDKSFLWVSGVIGIAVVLVAVALLLVSSWTFAALVVVMAITIIVIGHRPPRIIPYSLESGNLAIAEKTYTLREFRAFGVMEEGAFYSIRLIPTKRFMPPVSLYFPPDLGEQIVDTLASSLPMQRIEPDLLDKLLDKIHL